MTASTRTTICSPGEVLVALGKGGSATDDDKACVNLLLPLVDSSIKSFLGWGVIQRTYQHILPDQDLFQIGYSDLGLPVDVVNNRISYAFPGTPIILQVPELPLRSVQSLYADYSSLGGQNSQDFPANTLAVQGTDFYIDFDGEAPGTATPYSSGVSWSGHIRRWIGVWPSRMRSILVNYTAGVTPDELDGATAFPSKDVRIIKYAAIIAAQAGYRQMKAWASGAGLTAQGPITSERIGQAAFNYAEDAVTQVAGMMADLPFAVKQMLQPFVNMNRKR